MQARASRGLERKDEIGLERLTCRAKSITHALSSNASKFEYELHTSLRHALCAASGQISSRSNLLVFLLAPGGSTSPKSAEIHEENPSIWPLPGPPH